MVLGETIAVRPFALAGREVASKGGSLVLPGCVVGVRAAMSGKGGEFIVPGCSRRGWSARFASSLSGLDAEAVGVFLVLRVSRERAMIVFCVCCGCESDGKIWGRGVLAIECGVMVRDRCKRQGLAEYSSH